MEKKKNLTIQDVANLAEVAPITVSRVVNGTGYVRQELKDRVAKAIKELGYVPNSLASSLRSKKTQTLALILSDITNPFFTTVARGVQDAADLAGFMVIACNTDEDEKKELKVVHMLAQRRVDGLLLVPARAAKASLELITRQHTPTVILDRRVDNAAADVVRCDSGEGAYQLGKLLVSLGHRRIAVLAGTEGISTSDDRIVGVLRAMQEAHPAAESVVYRGELTPASGSLLTRKAMQSSFNPTALFTANNFLAIGALRALGEMKRKVPEEVALVGFDDLPPALVSFPFLTVASQPAYEMGKLAVEMLLRRIQGEYTGEYQEILLPTELIIRRSSGAALS